MRAYQAGGRESQGSPEVVSPGRESQSGGDAPPSPVRRATKAAIRSPRSSAPGGAVKSASSRCQIAVARSVEVLAPAASHVPRFERSATPGASRRQDSKTEGGDDRHLPRAGEVDDALGHRLVDLARRVGVDDRAAPGGAGEFRLGKAERQADHREAVGDLAAPAGTDEHRLVGERPPASRPASPAWDRRKRAGSARPRSPRAGRKKPKLRPDAPSTASMTFSAFGRAPRRLMPRPRKARPRPPRRCR